MNEVNEVIREEPPIIKMVNSIIFEAIGRDASTIRIKFIPCSNGVPLCVFEKKDSEPFRMVKEIPGGMARGIFSRIKIMCGLYIVEHHLVQIGKCEIVLRGDAKRTIRVIFVPVLDEEGAIEEEIIIQLKGVDGVA